MEFDEFIKYSLLSLINKQLENGTWMNDPVMTCSAIEALVEEIHGPKIVCRESLLYRLNKGTTSLNTSFNLWDVRYSTFGIEEKISEGKFTHTFQKALSKGFGSIFSKFFGNLDEKEEWIESKMLHIVAPADPDSRLMFGSLIIDFRDNENISEPWLIAYRGRLALHWDHPYNSKIEDKSNVKPFVDALLDSIKKDHWESNATTPEETTAIVVTFLYDPCTEYLMSKLNQGDVLKELREPLVQWILKKQNPDGSWANSPHITSHNLRAIITLLDNSNTPGNLREILKKSLKSGISFLLKTETVARWDNLNSYQDVDILRTIIQVSKFNFLEKKFFQELNIESIGVGPNVFLSFGYCDEDFAMTLANDLADEGIHLWFAEFDIDYGDNFIHEIEKGMKSTRTVVIILSPEANKRKGVLLELNLALRQNKKIIPVLFKKCKPPNSIEKLNWIDFTNSENYEDNLRELLRHLKGKLKDRKDIS